MSPRCRATSPTRMRYMSSAERALEAPDSGDGVDAPGFGSPGGASWVCANSGAANTSPTRTEVRAKRLAGRERRGSAIIVVLRAVARKRAPRARKGKPIILGYIRQPNKPGRKVDCNPPPAVCIAAPMPELPEVET